MILWKNKALELQLYLKMKIGLFAVKKKANVENSPFWRKDCYFLNIIWSKEVSSWQGHIHKNTVYPLQTFHLQKMKGQANCSK